MEQGDTSDEQNSLGIHRDAQQRRPQHLAAGAETRGRRRVLDEGLPPADIAREIGPNDCMLRDWLKDERVRRASVRHPSAGFAEVTVGDTETSGPRGNCPGPGSPHRHFDRRRPHGAPGGSGRGNAVEIHPRPEGGLMLPLNGLKICLATEP
ncbi:hypothetical protein, partial [Poseidonocella sp. HB161398]|uniref:hypothetical protein n=1 Tax=Poseidonocella sp. HB161398 TaxID=2320855 RepID=UPI0019821B09